MIITKLVKPQYSKKLLSDGTDIVSANAVLDNESTDKVLELVNAYLSTIQNTCSNVSIDDRDYPIYVPLYTVVSRILADTLMTVKFMDYIHKQISLTVDKIGVYFRKNSNVLAPYCVGLHISNFDNMPRCSGNTESKEYIRVWIRADFYNGDPIVYKCFEKIDSTYEAAMWKSIDPINLSATYEFVDNKYRYIDGFTEEFIETASRIKELR